MFVLIDNYDSFTYNLVHFLGELGVNVRVYRNDVVSAEEIVTSKPQGIILSPGPCDPDKAGICLDLVRAAAGHVPVLGVCLGHQAIAQAFGARIVRAPVMMHGKLSAIYHDGKSLFTDLPSPFTATRYHSLTVEPKSVPETLHVVARTQDDVIMAIEHREYPIYGVQFHPESIASEHGHALLANFLKVAGTKRAA